MIHMWIILIRLTHLDQQSFVTLLPIPLGRGSRAFNGQMPEESVTRCPRIGRRGELALPTTETPEPPASCYRLFSNEEKTNKAILTVLANNFVVV